VHGNHDDCYAQTPPEGCECIDGEIYKFEGLRILGLGGSMRYKNGEHQYTEKEMRWRVFKLMPKIMWNGGVDIIVTHAPAFGLNDGKDWPHKGFDVFNKLIDKYKPAYFIHGHVHANYGRDFKRVTEQGDTTVINAYERYIIET
jgi:Icc-related predicted phosphoesterase